MQNYSTLENQYATEYWNKLYNYYAAHGISYKVTYYNLDVNATVWDKTDLFGGYYEKIGELSGVKWKKILLLPVFQIGETSTIFEADETGYINKGESELVIPSLYGITPYPNDIIQLNRQFLSTTYNPEDFSIFTVTGVQKQSPQQKTWWKLTLKIEQSRREGELETNGQVTGNYTFFDYTKKIYTIQDAMTMTRMMAKNSMLKEEIKGMVDQNSGFLYC